MKWCGAAQVEAVAVRACLVWAGDRGFQNFQCESDSLQIVQASRNPSTDLSDIGQVMEDIKELLSTITGAILTHTCSKANNAAHRLAR
ncbi:hypothetical protein D8674_004952 [Pyrus ussuriensis x Pyrus communis]|uniref:RNase H type-1 domain-containing protein n=1 Tax=Pyrus ussuriensis x Pyrus communis TaxID=2448454 RepID=A0A5N5FQ53_9ROSA|nr:hypothetical protein D8674_004952 [Pyrus ussuriensis x Pyrus communis]